MKHLKQPTKKQLKELINAINKVNQTYFDKLVVDLSDSADIEKSIFEIGIWYTNAINYFDVTFGRNATTTVFSVNKPGFLFITGLYGIEKFLIEVGLLKRTFKDLEGKQNSVKLNYYSKIIPMVKRLKGFNDGDFTSFLTGALAYYDTFKNTYIGNKYHFGPKTVKIIEIIILRDIIGMLVDEGVLDFDNIPKKVWLVINTADKYYEKHNQNSEMSVPLVKVYTDDIAYQLADYGENPFVETDAELLNVVLRSYNKLSSDIFDTDNPSNTTLNYHSKFREWLLACGHLYEVGLSEQANRRIQRPEKVDSIAEYAKALETETKNLSNIFYQDGDDTKLMTKSIVIYKSSIDLKEHISSYNGKVPVGAEIYAINENEDVIFISLRYPYVENINDMKYNNLELKFIRNGNGRGKLTITDKEFPLANIVGTTSIKTDGKKLIPGKKDDMNFYVFFTIYGFLKENKND